MFRHAVAASVADQKKKEGVERFELRLERRECLLNFRLGGLLIFQHNHAVGREAEFVNQGFGSARGPLCEFLLVLRIPAGAFQNESGGIGQCGRRHQQNKGEQQARPGRKAAACGGMAPRPGGGSGATRAKVRELHARPFLFLQNH